MCTTIAEAIRYIALNGRKSAQAIAVTFILHGLISRLCWLLKSTLAKNLQLEESNVYPINF